jgi:hypothetical protein
MLWIWLACVRESTEWDPGEACWDGDQVRVHYGCLDVCFDVVDVDCWLYVTDEGIEASTVWELASTGEDCGRECVDMFVTCERMFLGEDPDSFTMSYAGQERALEDAACDEP